MMSFTKKLASGLMWWLDSGAMDFEREPDLMRPVSFRSSFKSLLAFFFSSQNKNSRWPDTTKILSRGKGRGCITEYRTIASCWHWCTSLVWLTCSVNSLTVNGFCLERWLCHAVVKCKCNPTQIWNKAEPFKTSPVIPSVDRCVYL